MAAQQGLSQINLLPKDSFEYSFLGRFLKWATTAGRALVVMTEFVVILAFASRFYFDKKLNDMTEIADGKISVIQGFSETEKAYRTLLDKQISLTGFQANGIKIGSRIDTLNGILPGGVIFDSISATKDSMALDGTADSETGYIQLLGRLRKATGIKDLQIRTTTFDQVDGRVKFSIQAGF